MININQHRNQWLRLDNSSLLKDCREEHYKGSGPGGQRRNKVSTAIRLHHKITGLVAQAEEERLLTKNRHNALNRLRISLALNLRNNIDIQKTPPPPEFAKHIDKDGYLKVNRRNKLYPIIVATILDALASTDSHASAATYLDITGSQLSKFLRKDPQVWKKICESRKETKGQGL